MPHLTVIPVVKKLLYSLFSIFLLYRTIELMRHLVADGLKTFSILETIFTSFILVLFATGVFAFLGFSFNTSSLLPKSYYSIKYPTFLSKIYDGIGVEYFRHMLLATLWSKKAKRVSYFDGTRAGFQNLIHNTKQSEFGHLGALVFVFGLSIPLLFKGYWGLFALVTIFNIVGNFYPVILQRKHRLRIQRISERYNP